MTNGDEFPGWERTRKELRARQMITWGYGRSGIPGTLTIEAHHLELSMPVGTVWYRFNGNVTLEILYSFVLPTCRRCGVRTYLHEKLLAAYPQVRKLITSGGTVDGKAWLRSARFKRVAGGDWVWERKRARRKS